MTQEIQWGPAIAVDGNRPGWLKGTDTIDVQEDGNDFYGVAMEDRSVVWHDDLNAIRLPADHPYYRQTEASPIDWSGELEAVHEDGRVAAVKLRHDDGGSRLPMRIDQTLEDGIEDSIEWFERDGSCNVGGWRIRNVPQPTPQADTKPDLTARMVALVRTVADETSLASWLDHTVEARAIVAQLPEPVDPVEAIVAELMRKDCTTRQAIEEAVHRGRALALAGEKEA